MNSQIIYRSKWTVLVAIPLIFVIVGCAGQGIAPTSPPVFSPAVEASPTQDPAASPTTAGAKTTATSEPTTDKNVLYQDVFTNPGTGWAAAEFDNYFIGYHEPEYYHIEIKSPHLRAPVVGIPDAEKNNFPDATVELQAYTVAGRTATDGDYRYGLVFRRSGDNYYAFTISPTTKKWEVFKSSPSGIVPLTEGVEESIQGLDVNDLLRVDAQGSNFLFSINDRLVGQVTDADYPEGTVGFYAENLENTNTHVHFDTLTIRDVKFSLSCSINDGTFNVRSGPSKTFAQLAVFSTGDTLVPLGVSPDREWIQIRMEGSETPGWISYSEGLMSCTPSIELFPIISP